MYLRNNSLFGLPKTLTAALGALVALVLLVPAISFAQDITLTPSSQFLAAGAANTATVNATLALNVIPEGTRIFYAVTAGPNVGTTGSAIVAGQTVAPFTYTDTKGVGTDTVAACGDVEGEDASYGECAGEAGDGGADPLSNNVTVKWEGTPTVTLTPNIAFNIVGSTHTVTATINGGKLGVCTAGTAVVGTGCDSASDCGTAGVCDLSGVPIGFRVISGPNTGDIGFVNTDVNGSASITYGDALGAGIDTLQACLDADAQGANDDSGSVATCLSEAGSEFGDVASNTVLKYWLANYVTGGGKVTSGNAFWTFGGIVGPNPAGPGLVGDWQEVSHKNGGKTRSCHFGAFTFLNFTGPATNKPPSTHNTATFTTAPGNCNDGTTPIVTVTEVDNGEPGIHVDTLSVSGGGNLSTGGTRTLAGGNVQVHNTQ